MEIVKLKYDNGTMSVRLPKWYCEQKGLVRNGYMVWKANAGGNLSIKPIEEALKDGRKISKDPSESDQGRSVPVEVIPE